MKVYRALRLPPKPFETPIRVQSDRVAEHSRVGKVGTKLRELGAPVVVYALLVGDRQQLTRVAALPARSIAPRGLAHGGVLDLNLREKPRA